jgi:prevent-host-death family protein
MEVTTKELRIRPGKILNHVRNGDAVTVTYRGKRLARIVPLEQEETDESFDGIFGMWADHEDRSSVEDTVRELRKGRSF